MQYTIHHRHCNTLHACPSHPTLFGYHCSLLSPSLSPLWQVLQAGALHVHNPCVVPVLVHAAPAHVRAAPSPSLDLFALSPCPLDHALDLPMGHDCATVRCCCVPPDV